MPSLNSPTAKLAGAFLREHGWHLQKMLRTGRQTATCLVRRPGEAHAVVVRVGQGAGWARRVLNGILLDNRLTSREMVRYQEFASQGFHTWLVTPFQRAGSLLDHRQDSSRPDLHQVWTWWLQAARALARLHRLGYCHNAVKPSNLLLGWQGGEGLQVRLADWHHATRAGRPVRRPADAWDPPGWQSGQPAQRANDFYRLSRLMGWLVDSRLGLALNPAKLERVVMDLPESFQLPLRFCLMGPRQWQVEDAGELVEMLERQQAGGSGWPLDGAH
jgi:serine/threonine protein kinase